MTDVRLIEILDAVDEPHKGQIGTHYEDCWKWHAGCLAALIRSVVDDDVE